MHLDFKSICRICLEQRKSVYFDIFTYYHTKKKILYCDMLSLCTNIKPNIMDELPHRICKECAKLLKKVYNFNLLCEDSNSKLKAILELKNESENNSGLLFNNELNTDLKNENDFKEEHEGACELENNENNINVYESQLGNIEVKQDDDDDIKSDTLHYWDTEDDEMTLSDFKLKKKELEPSTEQPKKKRGRKKKEASAASGGRLAHQCDECGKFLSSKSNLKAHKICHTDLRPYQCSECPSTFRGYSALFQHKKTHSQYRPYHCEYCSKQFGRRNGLVNHIRIHTGEKLFSCDVCLKTFTQSAQLSIHMKRHMGDKSFLCQECGKGFPIRADLVVHQRIHTREKPYKCTTCEKTFATSGNLSIHIRVHNREIKYNCKLCGRGFITHSSFRLHVKRHTGQKDYKCDCGKKFYTSSALKQHKVMHTGERKYQCKICEKKFTQTSHLGRHFRKSHSKPNMPMPPAEEYKIILTNGRTEFTQLVEKLTDVKYES